MKLTLLGFYAQPTAAAARGFLEAWCAMGADPDWAPSGKLHLPRTRS